MINIFNTNLLLFPFNHHFYIRQTIQLADSTWRHNYRRNNSNIRSLSRSRYVDQRNQSYSRRNSYSTGRQQRKGFINSSHASKPSFGNGKQSESDSCQLIHSKRKNYDVIKKSEIDFFGFDDDNFPKKCVSVERSLDSVSESKEEEKQKSPEYFACGDVCIHKANVVTIEYVFAFKRNRNRYEYAIKRKNMDQ